MTIQNYECLGLNHSGQHRTELKHWMRWNTSTDYIQCLWINRHWLSEL